MTSEVRLTDHNLTTTMKYKGRYSERSQLGRVLEVFHEHEVVPPPLDHLELIARFALESAAHFRAVSVYAPTDDQVDAFCYACIRACVLRVV